MRDATTPWAAVRVDVVWETATNTDYAWMAPGSNYVTFEVSWDWVNDTYVPVIGGLFCTNVPARSCDTPTPLEVGPPAWTTNFTDLILSIDKPTTNNSVSVTLHNTTNALLYNLVSWPTVDVNATNWPSELLVWGANSTTNTLVTVEMAGRDNLFLWAYSISNAATIAELDSLRYSTGIVNGVTNYFAQTNVVAVGPEPILYGLSMGYSGEDIEGALYGGSDPYASWKIGAQGVIGLYLDPSARRSVTNLFMANNNLLSSVDLGNCQKLRVADFYNCGQLASVALTNCPNLFRACFERCNLSSIDYSGATNLVDIRLARNQEGRGLGVTNIVFGGAGPKLRHFCIHSNPHLAPLDLSNLFSVQELWFYNCNQGGHLAPVSTNLLSVWAHNQGTR